MARYRQLEKLFRCLPAGPGRPTPDVAAAPARRTLKIPTLCILGRTMSNFCRVRDHMPFVLAEASDDNLRMLSRVSLGLVSRRGLSTRSAGVSTTALSYKSAFTTQCLV